MPAPLNNQNGLKIKNSEMRQRAFEKYCEWLAKGKSSRSFTFIEGELMCTGQTIETYIRENPVEFPSIHIEIAKSKGYAHWEQIVEDSATGANPGANTASLQMVMRNKFDWDREQKNREVDTTHLDRITEFFSKFLQTIS